jgi:hypothetical protein
MNEFAQAFDAKRIVVFSQTLESAEGEKTRIVRTDLQDEILKIVGEGRRLLDGISLPEN